MIIVHLFYQSHNTIYSTVYSHVLKDKVSILLNSPLFLKRGENSKSQDILLSQITALTCLLFVKIESPNPLCELPLGHWLFFINLATETFSKMR